jgi:hypothetical protein
MPALSGGGNMDIIGLNKFGPALRWMSYEAITSGLRTMTVSEQWDEYQSSESLTLGWRILEILPLGRLTYEKEESVTHRYVLQGTQRSGRSNKLGLDGI